MSLYFYIINESMPKPAAMKTAAKKKRQEEAAAADSNSELTVRC